MIATLLVANRGEIARRILRTAAAMGIGTVAVYAEGDAGAPFVTEADRALALPGRTAGQTYLNIDALLAAAAAAGADAVHPGYGFLSERAGFARAVTAAGLTWVGPPAEVIEVMGDKLAAKRLLADVGVPVLESWEVTGDDLPDLSGVPLPLIVKAAMGGGGKGMRVVGTHAGLAEAVAAARREAAAAFGDGTVFLERYITDARHVEIQVLADGHGGLVHCFERECSIQRRHQKIIEECPSPAVDPGLRERMGAAALAAAKAVGYLGAGTVEFVLEPSGDFWFLEVNTRLQVEHPVTEAVTGVDLVREQLLVAQGLPLSVTQDGLAIDGHAIEARLYAEDPAAGFLPATGTLIDWCPATAPPCRWDAGVAAGSVVGVEFDPMLAKVIAHAPARGEAALALALALAAQPDPGRHHQQGLPRRRAAPPGFPGRPHHHVVHRAQRRPAGPAAVTGGTAHRGDRCRPRRPGGRPGRRSRAGHAAQRLAQHRDATGAGAVPAWPGHRGGELRPAA